MERFTNISFGRRMEMGDRMALSQASLSESLVRFAESWGLPDRASLYRNEAAFYQQVAAVYRIFDRAHGVRKPRKIA